MNKTIRATGVALGLIALAACSSKSQNPQLSGNMDLSGLAADVSISPENKAEQYAKAGEQLAQTSSFALAEPVLDQALSLDPSNKRAQLYKAFLAQNMALRGVLVRIKPMLRKHPESVADYNKMVSELPKGALRDFLMDGQEDIKTEKEVQAFLDSMHEGREQLRLFLKGNKDLEITLRLSDLATSGASKKNCTYSQEGQYSYNYSCNTVVVTELKMNRADVEAMQQMVAGAQVYSALLNSYDLSGSIAVAKNKAAKYASGQQIIDELSKTPEFATLRPSAAIAKIADMGMDAIAGVRWAAELQKELCPAGVAVQDQRPGQVFSEGICIQQKSGNESLESVLQQIELALSGQAMEVPFNNIMTEISTAAPILKPVQDLKSLQLKVNKCGHLSGTSDATLGGVFIKGDAKEILAADPCAIL